MPIFKRSRRKNRATPLMLFDFDGTLADTLDTGVLFFNEIASDYGLREVSRHELEELRRLNSHALLDRLGISRLLAVKLAARLRVMFRDRITDVSLLPGVGEALHGLREKGYAMAILSSNAAKNIRKFLAHHGIAECFEFVEGGASLFGKGERLKRILRREKLEPSEVMYIGDETRDMEAARKAGVRATAACWGVNEQEAMTAEDPEFVLLEAADLLAAAKIARMHDPHEHLLVIGSGDVTVKTIASQADAADQEADS